MRGERGAHARERETMDDCEEMGKRRKRTHGDSKRQRA